MTDYFALKKSVEREQVISSLLGKDILEGESMMRLRTVSFLGALNVAANVPEPLRFSRYDHSVSVAYLTWLFCNNLGIKEEFSSIATLAALIHDITHMPFSHSAEVYLQIRSGTETKHTSALTEQKIIKVVREGYNCLPSSLQKETPKKIAGRLYRFLNFREERKSYHAYLADIIDAPFCPDTFDGINRAWYALNAKEAKDRLVTRGIKCLNVIDPVSLIRFVSSTTPFPFVFKSTSPPTKANLIYKFHDLMRTLYNDIIYSDWQSSTMTMFARALEIVYLNAKGFEINQDDVEVIKKITRNPISNKLYSLIVKGHNFLSLSKENPFLYKLSLDNYARAKKQNKSFNDTKRIIESAVASELKIDDKLVFWHKYRPLIWSSANIHFKKDGKDENLWSLKWEVSEGEPSRESKIEIYYTTLV